MSKYFVFKIFFNNNIVREQCQYFLYKVGQRLSAHANRMDGTIKNYVHMNDMRINLQYGR